MTHAAYSLSHLIIVRSLLRKEDPKEVFENILQQLYNHPNLMYQLDLEQ